MSVCIRRFLFNLLSMERCLRSAGVLFINLWNQGCIGKWVCGSDFSSCHGKDYRKKIKLSNQEKPVVFPVAAPCPDEHLPGPSYVVYRKYERSWSKTAGRDRPMI